MDNKALSQVIDIVGSLVPRALILHCVESYTHNDPCHNVGHMVQVLKEAQYLVNKDIRLDDRDKKLLYTSALLHDLGCRYDRKNHHLISYGMTFPLLETLGFGMYTKEEINIIALAVKEHRSSGDGGYTTFISQLTALADKGKPDLNKYITAAVLYRKNLKIPRIFKVESILKHIEDKFGKDGYCWKTFPKLGLKLYKDEIEILIEAIKDRDYVKRLIVDKIKQIEA